MDAIDLFQDKGKFQTFRQGPQFRTKGNFIVAMIAFACFVIAFARKTSGKNDDGLQICQLDKTRTSL